MPKFILDYGSTEAVKRYNEQDTFTRGYIEAMFFTNTGTGDDGELEHATVADLDDDAWETIIKDCKGFQENNAELLEVAYGCDGYNEENAGHDFWYDRNGHGTGFWDREALDEELQSALNKVASAYPTADPFMTDQGRMKLL